MTPDEAISDLTKERERLKRLNQDEQPPFEATQLGIEALERLKELRRNKWTAIPLERSCRLLPSETEGEK